MNRSLRHFGPTVVLLALAACIYGGDYEYDPVYGFGYYDYESDYDYGAGYGPHIPDGHLPPPGECRAWDPTMPPGQQPPPEPC